jgi:GT2 family glycosyltransferase
VSNLSIVIVNWNSGSLLRECLRSLPPAALPPGWEIESVVVVDNASTDGSARGLEAPGLPLRLIENADNLGFAAACNQGAAASRSEFVLFLNPDTRLFEDSLRVPVAWLADPAHAQVGIVGIPLVDASGAVARSCARFPRPRHFAAQACGIDRVVPALGHLMREWDHASTREVDQVIGAFFLTRRSLFDRLQGFDERFFVYFEEVDFALRARELGFASVFLTGTTAFHVGGGSTGSVKGRRLFYSLRARTLYAKKHFSLAQRTWLWSVTLLMEPPARAIQALMRGRWRELSDIVEGYSLFWRSRHAPGNGVNHS